MRVRIRLAETVYPQRDDAEVLQLMPKKESVTPSGGRREGR
jgi:hypothetical protein